MGEGSAGAEETEMNEGSGRGPANEEPAKKHKGITSYMVYHPLFYFLSAMIILVTV